MKKIVRIRNATLLEVFHDHLSYEFFMLISVEELLSRRPFRNQVEKNALIESFCVHARNLFEFFDGRSAPNIHVARDFADSSYVPFSGSQKAILTTLIRNKVNNQIAHLILKKRTNVSLQKVTQQDRDEMRKILVDVLQKFKVHLQPAYDIGHWPVQILRTLRAAGIQI